MRLKRLPARVKATRAAKRKGSTKEHNQLQNACRKLAKTKYGIVLYKVDSKARKAEKGNFYYSTCTPGISDSFAVIPPTGRFAGFEIKTGSQDPKESQRKFRDEVLANGGAYYRVRSIHEFDEFMRLLLAGEKAKQLLIERKESK